MASPVKSLNQKRLPFYRRITYSDTGLLRQLNRQMVFSKLKRGGPMAIAPMSRETGLSISTVKTVITELSELGLTCETGEGQSTGGRKPMLYDLNLNDDFVVATQIYKDNVVLSLCSLRGHVVHESKSKRRDVDPHSLAADISQSIRPLLEAAGKTEDHLIGICVAVDQAVDKEGIVHTHVDGVWQRVELRSSLSQDFTCPVFVISESQAKVVAEIEYGVGQEMDSFVLIDIGEELSGGVVANGLVMVGALGLAGDIGAVECGPPEGTADLLKQISGVLPGQPLGSVADFAGAIENASGDTVARVEQILTSFINRKAQLMGAYGKVLNPAAIVVAGEVCRLPPRYLNLLRSLTLQELPDPQRHATFFEVSGVGAGSVALGAAAFVLQHSIELKEAQNIGTLYV
jgi:predicted NBD/HSP70 family sugar kinase